MFEAHIKPLLLWLQSENPFLSKKLSYFVFTKRSKAYIYNIASVGKELSTPRWLAQAVSQECSWVFFALAWLQWSICVSAGA